MRSVQPVKLPKFAVIVAAKKLIACKRDYLSKINEDKFECVCVIRETVAFGDHYSYETVNNILFGVKSLKKIENIRSFNQ